MNASFSIFAEDFFVAAIEVDGFIKTISQMPYGRPFRTKYAAIKESKRFLGVLTRAESLRIESAIIKEASR